MSSISGSTSAPSSRCSTPSPMSGGSSSASAGLHRRPGDRVAGDDDEPLGAEVERRLDRRVQPRPAVDVPAARVRRLAHAHGREQDRDRRRRHHVVDADLRRHVRDRVRAVLVARLRRLHEHDAAPGARRRRDRRDRVDDPAGDVQVELRPVDPAVRGSRAAAPGRASPRAARRGSTAARRRSAAPPADPVAAGSGGSPCPWSATATARPARRSSRRRSAAASPRGTSTLIAPTLVPTNTVGRSPRTSSSGSRTDSAPASYAPRAPPPASTSATDTRALHPERLERQRHPLDVAQVAVGRRCSSSSCRPTSRSRASACAAGPSSARSSRAPSGVLTSTRLAGIAAAKRFWRSMSFVWMFAVWPVPSYSSSGAREREALLLAVDRRRTTARARAARAPERRRGWTRRPRTRRASRPAPRRRRPRRACRPTARRTTSSGRRRPRSTSAMNSFGLLVVEHDRAVLAQRARAARRRPRVSTTRCCSAPQISPLSKLFEAITAWATMFGSASAAM